MTSYGLKCWGAVTLTLAERNLCAKDEKQRAASVDYVKSVVTMVKELDGTEITIVPSTVGKIVPDGTPEEEWAWCVESLKEIHEHANKAGVVIAIEPLNRFETHFINRGEQALALADAVAPDVGVCLDCFHMNIEEVDLLETIRTIGPRLRDFHVADNNRMACGMGALDWPAIVGALREINYDGALTVEFVAPIDRTPANQYPDAVETAPGRHQPRGAAVHHRPRQQPAVGELLQHARREVRDNAAAAHPMTPSTDREMIIRSVDACWLSVPIPTERQHVSDFGRISSFDMALVRIERRERPGRLGRVEGGGRERRAAALRWCRASPRNWDPSSSVRTLGGSRSCGRRCTTAPRGHYALSRGRTFPVLGRRGLNVAAMSGVDMALWDLLGKSLGAPVVDLWGGPCRADMPLYASGGWAGYRRNRSRAARATSTADSRRSRCASA